MKKFKKDKLNIKTILFSFALFISTLISAQDKHDILISKLRIAEKTTVLVNTYIDKLASKKSNVSTSQWETIKYKIDYSPYLIGVKSVFMDHYTIEEIDEILAANDMLSPVNDTGELIYEPKPEVNEKMYRMSRAFGKLVNVQIKKLIEKLKA